MDPVLLARIQFAFTIGFHFIFPPISIGMAWLIAWIMTRWVRTGEDRYRDTARFWIRIFGATFAMGVATGITMEFQFGTNWATYSRYVGDIFGAPLAAEAIFSFFLESSFLALLLLGWSRLSRRALWFASLMVAVGATLSAFWILAANSWQQTPAGYRIVGSRAELTSFFEAIFNPSTLPRFFHTLTASFVTGAFFMMALSACVLLRRPRSGAALYSLKVSLVVALVSSLAQVGIGHWHTLQVVEYQPAKLAAFEAHFRTESPAGQTLIGIPDEEAMTVRYGLTVPMLLSLMAYADPDATVRGLEEFPREDWPPVALTFLSFRLMVAMAGVFVLLPAWGVHLWRKGRLANGRLFLWATILCLPLPTLCNELGWITAEVGRQPWVVWHLLRTSDAVSPVVSAREIVLSLAVFGILYLVLFILWIAVLTHLVRRRIADEADRPEPTRGEAAP
ncbi:cytochrome ubiquinol oxidase subunit I [Candidatus Sumerlaeota bacterium]|nr:cytochrome ubiquinol oxidase subunit I [Candidatus Sumerlaeota bacterium]